MDSYALKALFKRNVPHILETIFLSMDYESYKQCLHVSRGWKELFTSQSFLTKARNEFQNEIKEDQIELYKAVQKNDFQKIMRLLSSGLLDVNYCYWLGKTLLSTAANCSSLQIVQLLLNRGAEHDLSDALMAAVHRDRLDVVQLLLNAGADINHEDEFGETPLASALFRSVEMVKLLLNRGAVYTSLRFVIALECEDIKEDIRKFLDDGGFVDFIKYPHKYPLVYANL